MARADAGGCSRLASRTVYFPGFVCHEFSEAPSIKKPHQKRSQEAVSQAY
jgi:hypothetical protein